MGKCLIFGQNYFSEMMREYVERYTNIEVVAYIVNKKYRQEDILGDVPVIPYEEFEEVWKPNEVSILVTAGYRGMNGLRQKISDEVREKGYKLQTFIHPSANIYADKVGDGNIILENATLGMHSQIGDGNIVWNGANISHHVEIRDYNFFAPSSVVGGNTYIGNNCFLGLNATVRGGLKVDDYTLVGASAYLNQNSQKYDVYVPGKREALRDKTSLEMFKI